MENTRRDGGCLYDYRAHPQIACQTKSLSASYILPRTRAPKLHHLRRPPHSDPKYPPDFSMEDEFPSNDCQRLTPRISIADTETDSQRSLANPGLQRPYLRYQARCLLSTESEMGPERDEGESFSFSDLDTVKEDFENNEDSDQKGEK